MTHRDDKRTREPINLRSVQEPDEPAPSDGIPWGELADRQGLPRDFLTEEQREIRVPPRFDRNHRAEADTRQYRASQLRAWSVPGDVIDKMGRPDEIRETQAMQCARAILRSNSEGYTWGLLLGGPGAGKTFAAGWWLAMVRSSAGSAPKRFITSAEIYDLPQGTVHAAERIEALCRAQALVVDDVAVLDHAPTENGTATMCPALQRVLFARYADRLPTLVTGNVEPKTAWPAFLGDERLRDRWAEIGVWRMTRDESLRRLHAARGGAR